MDSLQIIKPPVEATVKSGAPSAQSSRVGESQGSEKESFSKTLSQVQPKSRSDADSSNTASSDTKTTEAPVTSETESSPKSLSETQKSDSKKPTPVQGEPALFQQGQELPSINVLTGVSLPVATSIPVEQNSAAQQATAAAAIVTVSGLVSNQIKNSNIAKSATGPGSVNSLLTLKSSPALTENLVSLDKLNMKSVTEVSKEETSVNTLNLLRQMQQPLAQKTGFVAGVNPDKIVDKAIKLLTANESFRSETATAVRTPESSLNVGLAADPLKIVNEDLTRTTQAPKINLPLSDSKWGEEFTNRIAWLSKNNIRSAQIKITPAHLGPIEVRVNLQNEQASVSFISNNAVVRDAIESASARLRESLAEGGFENVDVDVSSRENMNRQNQAENETTTARNSLVDTNEDIIDETMLNAQATNDIDWDNTQNMGVDYFA